MLIGGLQKTSLIDYPDLLSCIIFTVGCNFRCPFCHNRELVTLENFRKSKIEPISEEEIFEFLKKRRGILDGVVITGGEPTLQKDLIPFCRRIKNLRSRSGIVKLKIKLDTNGSNPEVLEKLIGERLVDYVAMDLKADWRNYSRVVGLNKLKAQSSRLQALCAKHCGQAKRKSKTQSSKLRKEIISRIKKSIAIILESGIDFEFRTTVVPGLHDEKTLENMAIWLNGQMARWLHGDVVKRKREKGRKKNKQVCFLRNKTEKLNLKTTQKPAIARNCVAKWYIQNFQPKNCLDKEFEKIEPFSDREIKIRVSHLAIVSRINCKPETRNS